MELVYVIIAVVVAAAAGYFLFFRKREPEQLKPPPEEHKLPPQQPRERPQPPPAEPEAAEPEAAREPSKPEPSTATEPSPPPPGPAAQPPEPTEPTEAPPAAPEEPIPAPAERALSRASDASQLRRGLGRARSEEGIFGRLRALFGGKKQISADITEGIEEVLLASDVGMQTTQAILARVRETLSQKDLVDSSKVWEALRQEARRILEANGEAGAFKLQDSPTVVLMVGVNGAGKTTTIGKLATKLKAEGRSCLLVAGDTFRAAAVEQLAAWGDRVGCEVVRGKEGADPSSVVFDAIKRGSEQQIDVVLVDTAGRLHTKANLMAEMEKIVRTAGKALEGAPHELLLVIDATNGQNALAQAKQFKEALPLTGIVLTKLDGTAKGGVVLGISDTLGLPVRFVGLGEKAEDMHDFSAEQFVEALLGRDTEASAA